MPKYLFCKSFFTIYCTLENKLIAITLANIFATKYDFIYEKLMETVCKIMKIKLKYIMKLKLI